MAKGKAKVKVTKSGKVKITPKKSSSKKKSNSSFIILVVIFGVVILGLLAFLGVQKGLFSSLFKPKEVVEPIIEPEPIVEPEPEIIVTFVNETKLDGVKDKFIDASYRMDGLDYYNEYIKVPYINMESDDAKKVNNEIEISYPSESFEGDIESKRYVERFLDVTKSDLFFAKNILWIFR